MNRGKSIILGSASGLPTPLRNATSVCLQIGDRMYLLDAGDGCAGRMVKMGLDVNNIAAVFISHMHPDHVGGLPMLLQAMQLTKRNRPLCLFMPAEGIPGLKLWLNTVYLMRDLLPFPLRIMPVTSGKPVFDDGNMRVCARQNRHLQVRYAQLNDHYPVKGQSYSFRMECGRQRMVYSGDIRFLDELLPLLEGGVADLMMLECAHYALDNTWEVFNGRVKTIVIHHIHPRLDRQGAAIKRAILKKYKGDVIIARDGMTI